MRQTAINILKRTTLASAVVVLTAGTAVAADSFGAIAFSQATGGYGFSYDHGTRREAESRAMSECNSRSRGCKVAIWFKNACGAVATGSNNGWGSAWAGSRERAERDAIGYCSEQTRNCQVLAWACTSR
jgi:serine/threonine-protein kinase